MAYLLQNIPRTGPDALPDWACEPMPMPKTPSVYCKHGTFIGGPLGPDYICGWCEQGDEPHHGCGGNANANADCACE